MARRFPSYCPRRASCPASKSTRGPSIFLFFPGETVTEGLDGLRARVKEYKELGAKFAKWRAVITIGDGIPTYTCLSANAEALARYAALCQEGGIVPIVEPEVLLDGNHTIERCQEVTEHTLKVTFTALFRAPSSSRRNDPQAEHGRFRQGQSAAKPDLTKSPSERSIA